MLTMRSRYALKALMLLANRRDHGPMTSTAISASEGIPRKFLEAILLNLRKAGVLESHRGPRGGYELRMDPEAIFLGTVIRSLSDPMAPLPCLSSHGQQRCPECVGDATCAIRLVMADAYGATMHVVDRTSLAELIARADVAAAGEAEGQSRRCREDSEAG